MNKEGKIRKLAYYFYKKRGCLDGHALNDWLKAEKEIQGSALRLTKCFKSHPWKYDLFISIVGGIVASGIISFLAWWFINWINPNKVILSLRYAYEYNYEKATQYDPVRKILENVPIRMSSGQNLWFAVVNTNINSLENCTLHLDFQEGLNIKTGESWQTHLPNKQYTYMFYGSLNNNLAFGTNPLEIYFVKDTKEKYKVVYSITAKNMETRRGCFFIEPK